MDVKITPAMVRRGAEALIEARYGEYGTFAAARLAELIIHAALHSRPKGGKGYEAQLPQSRIAFEVDQVLTGTKSFPWGTKISDPALDHRR